MPHALWTLQGERALEVDATGDHGQPSTSGRELSQGTQSACRVRRDGARPGELPRLRRRAARGRAASAIGIVVLFVLGVLFVLAYAAEEGILERRALTTRGVGRAVFPDRRTSIMMQLYSGTTCPFSHRCRFVLYEKGMDFQVIDVDLYNKPEDIAVMNPYNRLPVLVERDLILYESNIINEYIDERFPHPQLMPADPVMRARARLMLFNMEVELFSQIEALEIGQARSRSRRARQHVTDRLIELAPVFTKTKHMLGDDFTMLDVAIAPLLWRLDHYGIKLGKTGRAADEVRRAHLLAPGVHRGADALRKGDAQVS